jgi:hypothetical protein
MEKNIETHQSRQYYGTTPENTLGVHTAQEGNDSVHQRSLLPDLGDQHQGYAVAERRYRVAAGPIITTEERISAARVAITQPPAPRTEAPFSNQPSTQRSQ